MSIRDALLKNPAVAASVAIGLLAVAGGAVYWSVNSGGAPVPTQSYYYDLGTGETFVGPKGAMPPITTPAQKAKNDTGRPLGVLAHMYACGSCSSQKDQFIGYLESRTSDSGASGTAAPTDAGDEKRPRGVTASPRRSDQPGQVNPDAAAIIVAKAEATIVWEKKSGEAGQAILNSLLDRCAGKPNIIECLP